MCIGQGSPEKHNQWAIYLSILVIAESQGTQCCEPKSRVGEDPCPSSSRQTGTSGPSSYLCSMGTLRGLDGPTASTESNTNLIQKHLPRHPGIMFNLGTPWHSQVDTITTRRCERVQGEHSKFGDSRTEGSE